MKQSHKTPRRFERGASFAELMLATLVVGTTIIASVSSLSGSAQVSRDFSDGPHEALMLAQEVHEAALLLPWEAEQGDDPNFGPDVVTLWDLDGLEMKPPRSADYEPVISHIGWTQDVSIRVVDMENPTVEVDPRTFEGDMLTELKVEVLKAQFVAGEFKWWISQPALVES